MVSTQEILKNSKLRVTNSRTQVLGFFLEQKYAIPHSDIEVELEDLDRVTIYRTINTFLEKGLIHEVNDGSGAIKYAVCAEHCHEGHHHDNHVHFHCTKCEQTRCLESLTIPQMDLPQGYTFKQANLVIEGLCDACG